MGIPVVISKGRLGGELLESEKQLESGTGVIEKYFRIIYLGA